MPMRERVTGEDERRRAKAARVATEANGMEFAEGAKRHNMNKK